MCSWDEEDTSRQGDARPRSHRVGVWGEEEEDPVGSGRDNDRTPGALLGLSGLIVPLRERPSSVSVGGTSDRSGEEGPCKNAAMVLSEMDSVRGRFGRLYTNELGRPTRRAEGTRLMPVALWYPNPVRRALSEVRDEDGVEGTEVGFSRHGRPSSSNEGKELKVELLSARAWVRDIRPMLGLLFILGLCRGDNRERGTLVQVVRSRVALSVEAAPESIRGFGGARGGVGTELCFRRTAASMPPNPDATLVDD